MLLAVGHINELGQVTIGIQANMQFNGTLLLPECGPRKCRQAED